MGAAGEGRGARGNAGGGDCHRGSGARLARGAERGADREPQGRQRDRRAARPAAGGAAADLRRRDARPVGARGGEAAGGDEPAADGYRAVRGGCGVEGFARIAAFDRNQPEAAHKKRAGVSSGPFLKSLRCRTRSEEHTSELQSLMRISYAVFCLKKKKKTEKKTTKTIRPTTIHSKPQATQ